MLEVLDQNLLEKAQQFTHSLEKNYRFVLHVDANLTRQLVSFQANKKEPIYRWYKYKEAFSAKLIHYLFDKYQVDGGRVLDPFAGVGTAIFAASERGNTSVGIELLPIGQEIIKTRKCIENSNKSLILRELRKWRNNKPWNNAKGTEEFNVLRITKGAYPEKTKLKIKKFLWSINQLRNDVNKQVLLFALLCILESIGFTRKDGQYLRWDSRSERTNGKNGFNKGYIPSFDEAIGKKLDEIISDLGESRKQADLFSSKRAGSRRSKILRGGSCLVELPRMKPRSFSAIITSPPYCNRYDYTRTYALELALLGMDEEAMKSLRQTMLSCTVENKEKDLFSLNPNWIKPLEVVEKHDLLNAILDYLEDLRIKDSLNNDGIIRMVKNYFYEMACVIYECYRVLEKNGIMIMVNDNVKYAGVCIPVDLILSNFAEKFGFRVKDILVLPQGKGNSSQQMGLYGREVLRKCVYVWTKENQE